MSVSFEWNRHKADMNRRKHGVDFDEAVTVFYDPLAVVFDDEIHSGDEHREIVIGHSAHGRLLVVCFAERDDVIRIFSSRKATKQEVKDYESTEILREQQPIYVADEEDNMLDEYRFDYSKAKPNRFLARLGENTIMVALDPDVAAVFTTPDSVNRILRALINTMPATN